jgi:hypothetical protein
VDQGAPQCRRSPGKARDDPSRFAVLAEGCPDQDDACDEDGTQEQAEELGGVVPVPVPNTAPHPGEPSVRLGCAAHEAPLQSVRATDDIRREEAATAEEPARERRRIRTSFYRRPFDRKP